jgi:uncharacterized protein with PQ loop repeat
VDLQYASLIAGTVSTIIFATSHIPMLARAFRTRDLRSYSATNLTLVNLGNAVHWLYIQSLPVGPIWFLHGFYTVVSAVMLLLYIRNRGRWSTPEASHWTRATFSNRNGGHS